MFAKVALDQSINKLLDYIIPDCLTVSEGSRVVVPVRGKSQKGTIISIEKKSSIASLQPIETVLSDESFLTPDLLHLSHWMAKYYASSLSKVLLSILPSVVRSDFTEKRQLFIKKAVTTKQLSVFTQQIRSTYPSQAEVLDVILKQPKGIFLSQLLEKEKISLSSINTLIKKKILQKELVSIDRSFLQEEELLPSSSKTLNIEQKKALDAIQTSLTKQDFQVHLLHGVTGSGKTEVYLQAIETTLQLGKQVIFLVPEISLTRQTVERLKSRFQRRIALLHHRLSRGERFDTWHNLKKGEIPIAIGARSAIFSPLAHLGLIIVDEEHDPAYKQMEEAPCYHARDIAIVRAKLTKATVILGSATPSLESYANAKKGKYLLQEITARAAGTKPSIHIVKQHKKSFLFSEKLLCKIKEKVDLLEQVILFLNRRGYYSCQICKACQHAITCQHCDMSLTYHRGSNILSCHICGFTKTPPIERCPNCQKTDTLKYQNPGTEQVERALHAIFPQIRTLRMDRDTTRHKGSHERIFEEFRKGKADVLIGTQMIAKGLHFPSVTLVGVLGADSGLYIPDFRSNESVFQLITQASGRAGRSDHPGEVIIQSALFENPLIQLAAKEDYITFSQQELLERKEFHYPPFTRLIKILFQGKDLKQVTSFANLYHQALLKRLPPYFSLHPITPCGKAKIKNLYRMQCLLKGKNLLKVTPILRSLPIKKPKNVYMLIDVDPMHTFF